MCNLNPITAAAVPIAAHVSEPSSYRGGTPAKRGGCEFLDNQNCTLCCNAHDSVIELFGDLLNQAADQEGPSPSIDWSQSTSSEPHCGAYTPLQHQQPVA